MPAPISGQITFPLLSALYIPLRASPIRDDRIKDASQVRKKDTSPKNKGITVETIEMENAAPLYAKEKYSAAPRKTKIIGISRQPRKLEPRNIAVRADRKSNRKESAIITSETSETRKLPNISPEIKNRNQIKCLFGNPRPLTVEKPDFIFRINKFTTIKIASPIPGA